MSRFPQSSQVEEETLRAENTQILYLLQNLLTNTSLAGLSLSGAATFLLSMHQVLICGTYVLPRLYQFWNKLRGKLAQEGPYQKASIEGMRLRLPELQAETPEARKVRAGSGCEQGLKDGWEDINGVLHRQGLPYLPVIIRTEVISRHHDDPLAGHFGVEKTRELVAQKYYWPTLRADVESYVKGCNVCLASKAVCHKPYEDLQLLPIPTPQRKDLSMDFVTGLPVSTNWKGENYDSILVIVDRLTKMVHYK